MRGIALPLPYRSLVGFSLQLLFELVRRSLGIDRVMMNQLYVIALVCSSSPLRRTQVVKMSSTQPRLLLCHGSASAVHMLLKHTDLVLQGLAPVKRVLFRVPRAVMSIPLEQSKFLNDFTLNTLFD